ncbi:MAG: VCBS repeat-containing protein [Thermoleophilia bacterium]|nr:VCBS repeat-containing protein [Thermoleophilia bacterium]
MLRALLATATATLVLAAPAAADWSGDGAGDVLAVRSDGALLLYRGTGAGAFQPNGPQVIGSGFAQFGALMTGDWSGDGKPDILAVPADGRLLLYRGNGAGGFVTGQGEQIGVGFAQFTALLFVRDWSGDGKPDLIARAQDGRLLLYRGNGGGGFVNGQG